MGKFYNTPKHADKFVEEVYEFYDIFYKAWADAHVGIPTSGPSLSDFMCWLSIKLEGESTLRERGHLVPRWMKGK